MGFFENVGKGIASYLNPAGYVTGDSYLHKLASGPPPAPAGYTDSTPQYKPYTAAGKDNENFAQKLYGGQNGLAFSDVFNRAFQNLGQPLHDNSDRGPVVMEGVLGLARAFVDRVHEKTGTLPSEEAVKQFVSQSVNEGYAAKFITGMPPEQIKYGLVDPFLEGNPDALTTPGTKSAEEQRLGGLAEQLDKVYDTGKKSLVSGYDETVYNPAKTRAVNDLAGQGMLTQPNSRYTLDAIEGSRGRDIASGLNTLEGERARGTIDLSKTIEDSLQRNRDRSLSANQFNKTFTSGREDAAFNQGIQRQQLSLAQQLGRMQAGGQKNNGLFGGLGGAASGAASGAMLGSAVPGIGTLAGGIGGALLGGLGGYFGSRRD